MTPTEFQKRFAELASYPKGLQVGEFLDLVVELVESAMEATLGHPTHVSLFVGGRAQEVMVRSTLEDDQMLSMLAALCQRMALKHSATPEKGS
jgi:hypothetical protein